MLFIGLKANNLTIVWTHGFLGRFTNPIVFYWRKKKQKQLQTGAWIMPLHDPLLILLSLSLVLFFHIK